MIFQQDGLLGFYAGVGTFGLRSGGKKVGLELMQWNAESACDSEDVNTVMRRNMVDIY